MRWWAGAVLGLYLFALLPWRMHYAPIQADIDSVPSSLYPETFSWNWCSRYGMAFLKTVPALVVLQGLTWGVVLAVDRLRGARGREGRGASRRRAFMLGSVTVASMTVGLACAILQMAPYEAALSSLSQVGGDALVNAVLPLARWYSIPGAFPAYGVCRCTPYGRELATTVGEVPLAVVLFVCSVWAGNSVLATGNGVWHL